jgi:two-component sensor histidine kinase
MPLRDEAGRIIRWLGTCTDIDNAKRQAELNEILSRELSHRIKNIFAVIAGLIGLSSRNHPDARPFVDDLRGRIAALGRAHEFARPHSERSRPTVGPSTLHGMLRQMLQPYPALEEGRVTIEGDDLPIDDRGATPIALVFHELATNAAKYGALSRPDGRIAIQTRLEGPELVIRWRESGGPAISAPPESTGFGTRLVEMSVAQQLGGLIDRSWETDGLAVTIAVAPDRLSRG